VEKRKKTQIGKRGKAYWMKIREVIMRKTK
jgi:hypothetical protein